MVMSYLSTRAERPSGSESGIALFLVLWVLMLLSVIVGEFCHAMRTELNITRNFKEETQAYYIAEAGLNRAIAELVRNEVDPLKAKTPDSEEEEEGEIRLRINTEIPPVPFGGGQFEVMIGNESGKVNINLADMQLLKMMLNGFDLEDIDRDVIVDSILDWRDKDNFHRLNGAEDDYYLSLSDPYECKDGYFNSVEELLLVKGVTREIFFGGLRDMVTVCQEEEATKGRKRSSIQDYQTLQNRASPSIQQYLTLEKRGKIGGGKGKFDFNKININAASVEMVRSLPLMTEELVEAVVEYRKEEDFLSLTDLNHVVGPDVYAAILPFITLETGPYCTIKSVGKVDGSKTRQGVRALVRIDTSLENGYLMIQRMEGAGLWESPASLYR